MQGHLEGGRPCASKLEVLWTGGKETVHVPNHIHCTIVSFPDILVACMHIEQMVAFQGVEHS